MLPTWIQLQIDFKYWNDRWLRKLLEPVGKFLRVNQATKKRDRLQFARILIIVKVDLEFPDQFSFINEKAIDTIDDVSYEWKPTICSSCKSLGHTSELCRKNRKKEVVQ